MQRCIYGYYINCICISIYTDKTHFMALYIDLYTSIQLDILLLIKPFLLLMLQEEEKGGKRAKD